MAVSEDNTPEELFARLMEETEGLIPQGFAEQIEKDLGDKFGVTRRLALVYLEKPFREVVERVERNREFAVATAHLSDVLEGHIKSYTTLLDWLRAAQTRMWMSIAVREDMDEVFKAAKAATAQAAREEASAHAFLTVLKGGKP